MRGPTGRSWLAVAALALGTVRGDFITFVPTDFTQSFGDPSEAIISLQHALQGRYHWNAEKDVVVQEVRLFTPSSSTPVRSGRRRDDSDAYGLPDNGHLMDSTPDSAITKTMTHTHPLRDDDRTLVGRRSSPLTPRVPQHGVPEGGISGGLVVYSDKSGGYVSFDRDLVGIPLGDPLYFEAVWDGGASYSRLFAVTRPEDLEATRRTAAAASGMYRNASTHKPEWTEPSGGSVADNLSPTTGVAGAGSTNSQTTSVGSVTASPEGGGSDGSGLPRGAVIGIAVGCGVLGLLLAFGIAWYLLRRRQQRKAQHPAGSLHGSGARTDELMAEKEGGADVDVAPHSPYSDEGQGAPGGAGNGVAARGEPVVAGAVAGAGAGAVAGADGTPQHLHDPPRSFTPYSDRPSAGAGTPSARAASIAQTDEARVGVPSPVPGRATPRALTTPYAHLVEEGMTEEEIRRLEEEERQLDAAIEQAGRR